MVWLEKCANSPIHELLHATNINIQKKSNLTSEMQVVYMSHVIHPFIHFKNCDLNHFSHLLRWHLIFFVKICWRKKYMWKCSIVPVCALSPRNVKFEIAPISIWMSNQIWFLSLVTMQNYLMSDIYIESYRPKLFSNLYTLNLLIACGFLHASHTLNIWVYPVQWQMASSFCEEFNFFLLSFLRFFHPILLFSSQPTLQFFMPNFESSSPSRAASHTR